ncbi:hypothetical protein [Mycobacteroides abscessus]|uniref:Transmembrane protein n=1 Tax=Mycobacteroides abscessus subsp. abscessus TaxID=1185650 RepID=A0AB38CZJ9_9MYCO|nr:hypothetical protein [Mycobacteroides abscessus]SHO86494.1 Uncharacterised protein [Mycobacteroides abscessus subsp. abscessus]SHP07540.1 Uncharacterised protein [Mycobacteroides abscessus subsp. abscessus]SHP38537.1 Uncharacterised protein [Mycobacteroides abscessus subsp. abscessus]SHP46630.1 Uncharacterised protein [Mycobacteroides abscessus subsp. abscessus]SHP47117.1 Uncharacterised protein [Mycobacteroides abscessus subsp. abscessus]
MGKWIFAVLLGFLGLGLVGDYPLIGFGMLGVAGLLVWMGLQGRQAVRVERARPVAARQARMDVQAEVNAAQRAANKQMRAEVGRARREAQRNVDNAVQRVARDQVSRWIA